MELEKQNILFLTRTMNLGGTENVILQLCEIFNPKVNKIVVCSCGGVNVEKLNKMGIKNYKISDIASKNPNVMLKTFFKIKKIIKEYKSDFKFKNNFSIKDKIYYYLIILYF